ncbi:hypothetical protein [Methylovorus mays]|uniref:hypothetical protein n=1 Tax=Methylovorus mays TaxID=184077 RepID=UPI001E5EDD09|nr:hypothetical protein [Methylovorus mays]MCB5206701.1 hypothetical protein [Methylovorus mays]
MIDYSIYYRRPINTDRINKELEECDIFISAFNSSDRVQKIFEEVQAKQKFWFIQPEYAYKPLEYPTGYPIVAPNELDEALQLRALLDEVGMLHNKKVYIDITGFMRHTLCFMIPMLAYAGLKEFTALYSEPLFYKKQENTTFTNSTSGNVRPVRGMAGSNHSQSRDFLIIGVGYDSKLINEVTTHKDNSVVYPLFAFPSLSPDMYQQSAIAASLGGDAAISGEWITNRKFAPANDPFSTAQALKSVVSEIDRKFSNANIYISPLSTKVQAMGFALYWFLEGKQRGAVSLILPECTGYTRETSEGIKRLWTYTIEL